MSLKNKFNVGDVYLWQSGTSECTFFVYKNDGLHFYTIVLSKSLFPFNNKMGCYILDIAINHWADIKLISTSRNFRRLK